MQRFEILRELAEDLLLLSINAEMKENEEVRILARNVREIAERILKILEENDGKGIDS
ncbi:MAG: hypothetical protein RQ967_01845 [Candidatus Caldipriscus sp.]|jgi:hypothetical protein|nr:hypothetical protein [Candidatus Caldipriscus sp.]